jgi:hypothetical protein
VFADSKALAPSPHVNIALKAAWNHDSLSRVIITDLRDVLLVHPATSEPGDEIRYEHLPLKGNLVTLRIIIAAYLLDSLPYGLYCQPPVEEDDFSPKERGHDPLGIAPPKPSHNYFLPDATLFISHKRLSDFDLSLLVQDRERALQFYRWKEHVSQAVPSYRTGITMTAESTAMKTLVQHLSLNHQLDPSELSPDVRDHIKATKRPCPLKQASLLGKLLTSTQIAIRLVHSLSLPQSTSICSVYTCKLTSIDGSEVTDSPTICVKLFDDRFLEMEAPDEDMIDEPPDQWFPNWRTAEEQFRNEYMAYDMLQCAQGSLLPFFYGGHLVRILVHCQGCGLILIVYASRRAHTVRCFDGVCGRHAADEHWRPTESGATEAAGEPCASV